MEMEELRIKQRIKPKAVLTSYNVCNFVNTAYCLSPNGLITIWGLSIITMIGVSPTGIMECPDMPVEG